MVFWMKNVTSFLLVLFFLNSIAVSAKPFIFSATEKHTAYSDSSLILIPFEYKQSALYHAFTYEVIDSVVNKLLKNDLILILFIQSCQCNLNKGLILILIFNFYLFN